GLISTLAGNGELGFRGDGGPATSATVWAPSGVVLDPAEDVYIASRGELRVQKVDAGTGIISTVAGNGTVTSAGDGGAATSTSLMDPFGGAVDTSGNIYIADAGSHLIRKVTAGTGIISTVGGNGMAGYSGDGGAATSASLNAPTGVALDAAGDIYIADQQNNRIRLVMAATGV